MIKINIKDLQQVLQNAAEKGCGQVKLQLYDNWEAVEKEQMKPSRPPQDYRFDVRYYNTVEFEFEKEGDVVTDKMRTEMVNNVLILHVEISDLETLMKSFGLEENI